MKLLTLLFCAMHSWAYIPEYSLITSHAADQHGRGGYLIEQELTFHHDSETYVVKESWLVLNENAMRVTLEGRGPLKGQLQGSVVYDGGQKSFITAGSLRHLRVGEDWLEPLFHFRNSKYLRSRLVNLKVAPPESLHDRPPLSSEGDPMYEQPGFIRLSRVGGDTAWAIGLPPSTGLHPTLWIEQDQFVLRKYRGADQVTLRADDYLKHENGLWFPETRSYAFGPYTVDVRTTEVKSLGKMRGDDPRLRAASLTPARDTLRVPEAEPLKEFYSRFR